MISSASWPKATRVVLWCAAICGSALTAVVAILAMTDCGWLDRPIQSWASHRLDRKVRFASLETHLLSADPSLTVRGLSISGPPWAAEPQLMRIGRLTAHLYLQPLLWGELRLPYLELAAPRLHLVRFPNRRNNWTLAKTQQHRSTFAALAGTRTLSISGGEFIFDDEAKAARLHGTFAQIASSSSMPFSLSGKGVVQGGEVGIVAQGGPLHGPSVDRPYPFVAHLTDGNLTADIRGTSLHPFDLTRYDLSVVAHGPNLADFAYLFNLQTPNSASFTLMTRAKANGSTVTFDHLVGRTGDSDFAGWVRSDQSTARHKVTAQLQSQRWTKPDVESWLSPLPPRSLARSVSGRRPGTADSRWLISNQPFPQAQLKATDLTARLTIGELVGYPVEIRSLAANVNLERGKLDITRLRGLLQGGVTHGSLRIDASQPVPLVAVDLMARHVDMGSLRLPPPAKLAGALDLQLQMQGRGNSLHAAAGASVGTARLQISSGRLPRPAAFLLGGDAIRAIGTLGTRENPVAMRCARADFDIVTGKALVRNLSIRTDEGTTIGNGILDLGTERLTLTLAGEPARPRLFKLSMPVLVAGPLARPSVSVLPSRNASRLGLKGTLGVALSPVAALLPLGRGPRLAARC